MVVVVWTVAVWGLSRSVTQVRQMSAVTEEVPIVQAEELDVVWEVRNAAGRAGAAAAAAKQLESMGYQVLSIGNSRALIDGVEVEVAAAYQTESGGILAKIREVWPEATLARELTDSTAGARLIIGR